MSEPCTAAASVPPLNYSVVQRWERLCAIAVLHSHLVKFNDQRLFFLHFFIQFDLGFYINVHVLVFFVVSVLI